MMASLQTFANKIKFSRLLLFWEKKSREANLVKAFVFNNHVKFFIDGIFIFIFINSATEAERFFFVFVTKLVFKNKKSEKNNNLGFWYFFPLCLFWKMSLNWRQQKVVAFNGVLLLTHSLSHQVLSYCSVQTQDRICILTI